MKFKGDIIITDPCYIIDRDKDDDWDKCGYGERMQVFGINTFLTSSTEYGDWSCTTVRDEPKTEKFIDELNEEYLKFFADYNNEAVYENSKNRQLMLEEYKANRESKIKANADIFLGEFCADAGLVSVFLLDEVLKYNPKFDYHTNRPWTTTLIKDFDGEIEITHRGEEVSVVGKGNVNFYTTQTGF